MSNTQTCLGYLYLKGLDGEAGQDIQEWICSLCLLRGGKLIHFDIDPKKTPQGTINLEQATAEVSTGPVPGALYASTDCFRCVTPQRTFHLYADNFDNRNKWVNLLTEHINTLKTNPSAFEKANHGNFELRAQISTAERVEFLTKSGGIKNLSWKKRLFVLNGKNLVYYELPQGLKAQGNYVCQNSSAFTDESIKLPDEVSIDRVIKVQTDRGKLLIGAISLEDKNRWSESLMSRSLSSENSSETPASTPVQQLPNSKEELLKRVGELTDMKDKSDKIIRGLKTENKKLKQTVEELNAQLREKEDGINRLTSTKQRMEIEVMEARDYQKTKKQ
eukprot:c12484_g1_i1.p1 GENE.c12484_g1_i1~~c12484_g1_i1.p1  ORF type:complete len:333 (-),score=104.63 c12484_g1_i1:108-1106(-)